MEGRRPSMYATLLILRSAAGAEACVAYKEKGQTAS